MKNFNGSFQYESSSPGGRGTKMKNRCFSPECKCYPPVVNVHHYQCPLMKIPCPIHGYPFVYNLKSKKTPLDQCLVISFQPSLKNDKLFEPVKTFLSQTCEPDAKINFQYYSPRLSETYREGFKHRQVQTSPEDFKKLTNNCFVEKTKTFFSDKTNKMKKLKQCFNSPCSSAVHKSRSCTAIKEKIGRIFREGTGDGNPDKPKLEKRLKAACCMKSEESSHFLYKRDFDLSDAEKSSKEKTDSDFIAKINSNLIDRNIFEMRSRKDLNGMVSANLKPHFMYPSFVSPDPIKSKVQGHSPGEEVLDLEKSNERSQNPDDHFDEPKEDKEEHNKASPDGNFSSDTSSSVYFTPFIFVPGRKDKEVEHKGIQTVKIEPGISYQWVQTIEYFHESVSSKNQTKNSELLVAKTNVLKTTGTQTSAIFMPEACICGKPQMTSDEKGKKKPDQTNAWVQTSDERHSALAYGEPMSVGTQTEERPITTEPEMNFLRKEESPENEPMNVGTQTEERPITTVVYYEPEMKFLRREESSENKPVEVEIQTEEKPITTVVYYEPEMKFLKREESSENEPVDVGVQTEEKPVTTVVYYEPEMKFLKREESSENKPVSVETPTEEKPVTTVVYFEPEMKFLRREENSENEPVSVGTQTEDEPIATVVYYEPEMKFLRKEESSENGPVSVGTQTEEKPDETVSENDKKGVATDETSVKKERSPESEERPRSKEVETQETHEPLDLTYKKIAMSFLRTEKISESVNKEGGGEHTQSNREHVTIIFEPETKSLRRKDENGKRGVLFSEEPQVKEIETDRKDESVGTKPETLEESERERGKNDSSTSQNKETQVISDSDTSQSYYDGSDSSNVTYVVKSYVSEESEQIVARNWNKSRSDGDMVDKKKCECLTKADHVSPPPCQCIGTKPNGLTFVGVYHSKKESYSSSLTQDPKKTQQFKPEAVTVKNEDKNASFADLSDLIRIIDENFQKMFDRTAGICQCQQTKEKQPTADKEVMTDISGDIDVILQMATKSMANAQIQACLPIPEEMSLPQSSNPDQKPPICKVCSKVISMTTVSVGTNTPDGSYIQAKIQEVDMGTYCEDFPIESTQEASRSKPESVEKPSTSTGKSGEIKTVRVSAKTFVTEMGKPTESNKNHAPSPTPRKTITYPEPFSDSTTSLQRDLRRAQQECRVKPKPSRPTPPTRSKPTPTPTPKPRQTQLPQSKPQVVTRIIPDSYCGNIVATITTRRIPSIQTPERCPFEPPPLNCDDIESVCPLPPGPNSEQCFQRTQPSKDTDSKQNHMTYHITLSSLWSKDIMKMFQRKFKKISKSESSDSVNDSSGKQKRNHDGGSDGGPIGKKIKSTERETRNIFNTSSLERERIDCFEFGKSQTDITFKFFMKGENEFVFEEESPRLTKDSGFVWVPSFPRYQFVSIRQVSSAEETEKSKETPKAVCRRRSYVLSKIPEENTYNNLTTKNTYEQNPDYTGQKNSITSLFRSSKSLNSCKSFTYLQLKNSDITEKRQTISANLKPNHEDSLKGLVFTPQTSSLDNIPDNSSQIDEQISPTYSEQKHVETVPSTETKISSSGTDQTQQFIDELYSRFLSERSDSNFELNSNQVETCDNSELVSTNANKTFNNPRSNKLSFRESSADVSNSKMATKSECLKTFRFCGESSTAIPESKKTCLKNFPSKIPQGPRRKFK